MQPHDPRMRDLAGSAEFAAEPLDMLAGDGVELVDQQLQRHDLVGREVVRREHQAHAPGAESLADPISAGDQRPCRQSAPRPEGG